MMRLDLIPPELAGEVWPEVESYIASALEREGREHIPSQVLKSIQSGAMQLFIVRDDRDVAIAAAVVAIHEYQDVKRCRVHWCGGTGVEKWIHLLSGIEDWAKAKGCEMVKVTGRDGWLKVLQSHGWEKQGVILGKRL